MLDSLVKESSIFIIFFHFHWTIHVSLQGRFLGKQLCVFIHIYTFMYVYILLYVYMYIYVYIHMYIHIHACIYV